MPTIGEKNNHVIVALNHGVVMRDDDFITPHHRADGCTFW
jgi:hypothetical protein